MTLDLEFHSAMVELYMRAKREINYTARYFIEMVCNEGGRETARYLLDTNCRPPGVGDIDDALVDVAETIE